MSADSTPHPQPSPFCHEHQVRAVRAIRELLTPAVLQDILSCDQEETFARALRRLQRLQPGQTSRAIWCHRVLVRGVREDLRTLGSVDARWTDALQHLTVYLEEAGWQLVGGRWTIAAPILSLPGRADTAAEPSAWELGLSAEAATRLRSALERMRRSRRRPDPEAEQ